MGGASTAAYKAANVGSRIASNYEQFVAASGFQLLVSDLLKSGSRLGFRFGEGQCRFGCRGRWLT